MKSITRLKHPDLITLNGEKFQVINHTSLWYHTDKKELEMALELTKADNPQITPDFILTYVKERPKEIRFFFFNKATGKFEVTQLKSYSFE